MKERQLQLETERLILRALAPRDQEALLSLFTNEAVKKTYMVPDYGSRDQAVRHFEKLMAYSHSQEYLEYGICLKETNDLIGFINDCGIDRSRLSCEVGYAIHPAYQGSGYGTEALKAVIAELFRMGLREVNAFYFAGNVPSRRVMEKCGMVPSGLTEEVAYRGTTYTAYGMTLSRP